jgi:hypothetical protein
MGTNEKNDGQSGTDKPEVNEFDALATAMQEGKLDEVNRLMAVEPKSEEAETPPVEEENPAADDQKSEEEEKSTPKDDSKSDEKPDTNKEKSEEAAPAASTSSKDTETLEELRQRLHRAQSDAGRVPYLQRQLEELRREIRAAKARGSENATQGTKAAPAGNINDVVLDPETQKHIDDLKEIDPVLAATIERSTKAAIFASSSKVDHAVTTMTEEEQKADDERFYVEQKSLLAQRIPNHEAIFATPEWAEWKSRLTPGQRNLAESAYANEVEQAIYAFAADMQRMNPRPAAAAQTQATDEKEQEKHSEVKEARERKVSQAAETKAPAAKTTTQLDEKAYFDQMYNEIGKKEHLLP